MAKHEAVDRLMALATEKRADRIPNGAPATPTSAVEIESTPRSSGGLTVSPGKSSPRAEVIPGPSAPGRGRQMFDTLRPLLPAVAGAMRLVDHGAVQALARLLPLLGGAMGGSQGDATPAAEQPSVRAITDLQAGQKALRRDLDAANLQNAASEDRLSRLRTQMERASAEQQEHENQLRALGDRVRLLSAGVIILLMLIVAQMILVVILLHK